MGWRFTIAALGASGALVLGGADPIAALILGAALLACRWAVGHRGRRTVRVVVAGVCALAVLGALGVAAATFAWHVSPTPFLVTQRRSAPTNSAQRNGNASPLEVLGFVASDFSDSVTGEDRDGNAVSELAATGLTLAAQPGAVDSFTSQDPLLRAHLDLARGYLVLSNYDMAQADFNGPRADQVLADPKARAKLVAALAGQVTGQGWDGIVVDLEQVGAAGRAGLVALTRQLAGALPGRPVLVAVPAWTGDPSDEPGFDLSGLAAAADRIVWMAYDQHNLATGPGPIADLRWVQASLRNLLNVVPAGKVLLGVAGYGYLWPAKGQPSSVTYNDRVGLSAARGARTTFDAAAGEVLVRTADGGQAWFADARSFALRTQLAIRLHLAGVALWRIGSEDPKTLGQLQGPVVKHPGLGFQGRPVQQISGPGVVALTFDDGPDPQWTPKILDVLEREHVPATFFVIGRQADAAPDLVRREVADGFVVGNHTYSHPDMNRIPQWRAELEVLADQAVLQGITGRKPVLYRSPYGNGDQVVAGQRSRDQLASTVGMRPVDWTDDPMDWARPGPNKIADYAVNHASGVTTILLHDGGGERSQTVAALPMIIDRLRAQGYTFSTADAVNGAVSRPYASRDTGISRLHGLVIVTGFQLIYGLSVVLRWLVLAVAVGSIGRLVICAPLAFWHTRRGRRRHRRRRLLRRRPATGARAQTRVESVTVLIPAHNEGRVIDTALTTLTRLPASAAPAQVIVINDGSTDDTEQVARGFIGRTEFELLVLSQPQSGKATALNAGIARAQNEILLVLDADTMVTPALIPALHKHFDDPGVGAVAGNVKVGNRRRLLSRLQAAEYVTSLNLDRRAQAVVNAVAVVPGAAGAFRRSALLDVGGYPATTLVEDADLTVRLLRAGWRIPYEPRAVAWTEAPQTVSDALRQRRRWAFGTIQVLGQHADIVGRRRGGAIGLFGLPWTLLSQVLLPAAAPIVDLYLLYLLISGDAGPAAVTLLACAVLDLLVIATAMRMEREQWSMLLTAPLLRWIWRPILVLAVVGSLHRWLRGETQNWMPSRRYASLRARVEAATPPTDTVIRLPATEPARLPDRRATGEVPIGV